MKTKIIVTIIVTAIIITATILPAVIASGADTDVVQPETRYCECATEHVQPRYCECTCDCSNEKERDWEIILVAVVIFLIVAGAIYLSYLY